MPTYLFWGEDDFAIAQSVKELRDSVLDPNWLQFNYEKLAGDGPYATIEALNQAMTPVFGMGGRLVWLAETNICQQCSEDLLKELKRTLPVIPANSHLLLTSSKKPDARLKSTKLLQESAHVQEFSLIPPWKMEEIVHRVRQFSEKIGVKLTPAAMQLLAESVGNNTRLLWGELEKLQLYAANSVKPLDTEVVTQLVNGSNQNSLQLATALREGNDALALELVADLLTHNEHPLRIIATLVGQFRTWAIVKLKIEAGEKDEKAIATAAELGNPKRIYFIRKEIQSLKGKQLLESLQLLMDLELSLKQGADPLSTLQTKVIELCRLFNKLTASSEIYRKQ
jgi:DNA polymerase-3 subunit delta